MVTAFQSTAFTGCSFQSTATNYTVTDTHDGDKVVDISVPQDNNFTDGFVSAVFADSSYKSVTIGFNGHKFIILNEPEGINICDAVDNTIKYFHKHDLNGQMRNVNVTHGVEVMVSVWSNELSYTLVDIGGKIIDCFVNDGFLLCNVYVGETVIMKVNYPIV